MFIGPRITKVFASRWHAAFWAVGILTAAYEFSSHGGPSASDVAQVASAAGAVAPAASTAAANPWAPGPAAAGAPETQPAVATTPVVTTPVFAATPDQPPPMAAAQGTAGQAPLN